MIAPLLNKHQLAEILGKPVTYVEENCAARRWPFTRAGREYRFTEEQAQRIIASLAVEPQKPAPAHAPRNARARKSTSAGSSTSTALAVPQGNPSRSRLYRQAGAV
ncbi:hypothetical protein AB0O28_19235 [Microbispora sp. NPDC088329]|uniref:hypothetical protein n=1 Tax=Microbispora sp. NPDC088329 TaxID=3154869 RepID=UPI00342FE157